MALVKADQRQRARIIASRSSRAEREPGRIGRVEGEQTALQVVIETVNHSSPVFAAELDGVAPAYPGEIIEDLKALAGAPARNTEAAGSKVLKNSPKINFGQSQLSRPQVEGRSRCAQACRVEVRIQRIKRGAIPAVPEADFIDLAVADRRKQAGGNQLHPRRRTLGKLR